MQTIKLIIVDDHQIFRESLHKLICDEPDMVVVGLAGDGREATDLVREKRADVVLLDITMPGLNGVSAIQRILDICKTNVVILSMHTSERMILEAMGMGAVGYLTKYCSCDEIIAGIRAVMRGKMYLSSDIDGAKIRRQIAKFSNYKKRTEYLSPREKEVLQLVAEGKGTKDIADILKLSEYTINRHRVRIMDKLSLRTVAELTKYAVREGLSPPD